MIKDYPNLARLAQPEPEAPDEDASEDIPDTMEMGGMTTGGYQ